MDDKERCAYHEAGHCVFALPLRPGVVRSVTLEETAQGWTGTSDIRWPWLEDDDVAAVALAGILAEAKGAALSLDEQPPGGITLSVSDELLDRLEELYADHLGNAAENSWQVDVQVAAGGVTEPAAISRHDLERIVPALPGRAQLAAFLQYGCDFFNDDRWWRAVGSLTAQLNAEPPPLVRSFGVYVTINDAL
jgi:hypothetical protein